MLVVYVLLLCSGVAVAEANFLGPLMSLNGLISKLGNFLNMSNWANLFLSAGELGQSVLTALKRIIYMFRNKTFTSMPDIADLANDGYNVIGKSIDVIKKLSAFNWKLVALNAISQLLSVIQEKLGYVRCMRISYCVASCNVAPKCPTNCFYNRNCPRNCVG